MTLKMLPHPTLPGHHVKMGRKRPSKPFEGLHIKRYLKTDKIVLPPMPFGYGSAAAAVLAEMYGNDNHGCCVISAREHIVGVMTSNAGDPVTFTLPQTLMEYGVCGFIQGNAASDQGCEIQAVLNHWISPGFGDGGAQAVAFLAVDPTNVMEIQTAIWLFENLVPGIELPDAWVKPMPSGSGFVWDVAGPPDPENGHCPGFYDVDEQGAYTSTWAMTGVTTYAAIAEYCVHTNNGELYVVLSPDLINKASQKAPNGLDWAALATDFAALGGTVTPPTPVPPIPVPPPPTPVPTPPPPIPPVPTPTPTPTGFIPLPDGVYGYLTQNHHGQQQVHPFGENVIGLAVDN